MAYVPAGRPPWWRKRRPVARIEYAGVWLSVKLKTPRSAAEYTYTSTLTKLRALHHEAKANGCSERWLILHQWCDFVKRADPEMFERCLRSLPFRRRY